MYLLEVPELQAIKMSAEDKKNKLKDERGAELFQNEQKLTRIELIMNKLGIKSYAELARSIKTAQSFISDIVRKKKMVPKTLGQKLEDHLNVSRKWFDTGQGEMFTRESDIRSSMLEFSLKTLNNEIFAGLVGLTVEELNDRAKSERGFNFDSNQIQSVQRYLQEHGIIDFKPSFIKTPEDYKEQFGSKEWSKIPDTGQGKNIFEISYNAFSVIMPLINKEIEKQYIGNCENEDFLQSMPKHCTTFNFPPVGAYRAFVMPDRSMSKFSSEKDAMQSIPKNYIAIARGIHPNFWNKKRDYSKTLRYVPYKLFVFVTKQEVLIRAVKIYDFPSGIIELHPLNDQVPEAEIITIRTEDILEMYDVIKKESPYLDPYTF